jgi:hypothetical protein
MQENQKNHTIIKDGRKFTDCGDNEIKPDSDPSGAFFGHMKGVTKKDSTSYKKRVAKNNIQHSKTFKKQVLNDLYDELNIRRIDSDE